LEEVLAGEKAEHEQNNRPAAPDLRSATKAETAAPATIDDIRRISSWQTHKRSS
jgi:hypothetical protein